VRAEHLYIHVPFCARRCVYCDFSIAVRATIPSVEYAAALDAEWSVRHGSSNLELSTLYFGGGTPSKLAGDGVARVLDIVRRRASIQATAEVTLEANPEDVTAQNAAAWHASGINRVSLGIQSFDDAMLGWMHRTHDAAQGARAVEVLRDAGIPNVSIDLIFATPSSVTRSWTRDVDRALALDVPHISVYGLTVEPHTPLGRWVSRLDVAEAPEDRFEEEFLAAHSALAAAGFDHYEVSNYGRPGMHSRHNWAYWDRRPYVGLGPSSHEFDGSTRSWNVAPYAEWERRAGAGRSTQEGCERLSIEQESAERVYLALRTDKGLVLDDAEVEYVQAWVKSGWATLDGSKTLRLTPSGWLRLDALASSLTSLRSR